MKDVDVTAPTSTTSTGWCTAFTSSGPRVHTLTGFFVCLFVSLFLFLFAFLVFSFYLHAKAVLKALVYTTLWSNYNTKPMDVVDVVMFN